MDDPQDSLVTSSQDILEDFSLKSGTPEKIFRNSKKKKAKNETDKFPWIVSFQKHCRSILKCTSMKELLDVIDLYTEHITRGVEASYSKPKRAAKLKANMIRVLCFFYNQYVFMKQPFKNPAYFEKMSNLLTLYFDMEVKASRRGRENVKKITSKLISALFIMLDNSAEHILDTLLKARFTVKSYSEICIPIFKMVTNLPQSQEMNYVRCLLVFKLWKKLLPSREERNSINRLAVAKLSPPPAQVLQFIKRGLLNKVLPTPPPDKTQNLITRFYMTSKFNVRESIKAFLKMEADLELNDFTFALDKIRFFDDDDKVEDMVPERNRSNKDYSLLESIWINISNSHSPPDQPSISPSTPGNSALKVGVCGNSCPLGIDSVIPSKVKKSLFKPKATKKSKQSKSKIKEKNKKKKEALIIDLCKENDENFSGVDQDVKSCFDTASVSPDLNIKKLKSKFGKNLKFNGKPSEGNILNNSYEKESNMIAEKKTNPEVSTETKNYSSCKSEQSISTQSTDKSICTTDMSLDTTTITQSDPELIIKEHLSGITNEKDQEKDLFLQDSLVKSEKLGSKEDKCKKNGNVESLAGDTNLVTATMDVDEVETPKNKIVISCKNFSRIDFKHEGSEEKSEAKDPEPEELTSSIEISEDPIYKTEILKEDSLHLKDDEESTDQLLSNPVEQDLHSEETNWNSCLIGDSLGDKLSSEVSSQNSCSEETRKSQLNLSTDTSCGPNSMFSTSFTEDCLFFNNKEINEKDDTPKIKPNESLKNSVNSMENSAINFGNEIFCTQNRTVEGNANKQNIKSVNTKIVSIRDIHGKPFQIIVNADNKQDLRGRNVQNTLNGIQNAKVGDGLSALNDNSNSESFQVSSSSLDDSNGMSNKNQFSILNNLQQESLLCKVEEDRLNKFSSCMQNSKPSKEKGNCQFKKCDKNIQVSPESSIYENNEPQLIQSSHGLITSKDDQLKNKNLNLHQNLNTCLLHKILGEEDCLKSGCLLKTSEKLPQDFNRRDFPDISLKQEHENSTELPCENSTSTIPSLWNASAGIKVEKENENSKSSECIEGIHSSSNCSEFLVRSVTEACNFRELGYTIESECDNFTTSFDFESDNEDRNLIIDEDIDSIKDHCETVEPQFNSGTDYVQNDTIDSVVCPISNNNHKLTDQNLACDILASKPLQNQEIPPKTNNITKENNKEKLQNEVAGKHKLPRIIESNVKTSYHRNTYVSEATVDSTIKYRPLASNEVLHTLEGNSPFILPQHYGGETSSVIAKHYTQPKIAKPTDSNVNLGHVSPDCRVFSPHRVPQVIDSNCHRINNRDPRLGPVNASSNIYQQKLNLNVQSNSHNQPSQIPPLQNIGSVKQLMFKPEMGRSGSPRRVSSPLFQTFSQYSLGSKTIPTTNNRGSPAEQFGQRILAGNDKYKGVDKTRQKRESPKHQENCSKNEFSSFTSYVDINNPQGNSNPSFLSYNTDEHKKMKTGDAVYDAINPRDRLCLVKSKEDPRETYDFEFNVLPIAQEIEICSASENLVGEWLYPVSNEIGHPDWPIANEQNVIDSSSVYCPSPDQYMLSLLKNDDASTVTESMDNIIFAPLELQQIDNTHPNVVGSHINKDKLNLHLRTLEGDNNLCCSQREFKEFYLSRDIPPTIPVPFPPQCRTDNLNSSVRCPCDQCSDNKQKLLSNYNLLNHFRSLKIKPLRMCPRTDEMSFSEKDPNGEFDCSLPLKKRKTLTNSKTSDEPRLPSYPNTPMISIAQLELAGYEQSNQVIVPNPQSQWRDPVTYNPLNLAQPPLTEPFDGQVKGKRKSHKRRKSSR